uniref:DUF627 domain-containing protein n=1 Tax=Aegilops tauschii subsp. strangulata TaxID=200361 RepID=A0A453IUY7_AEGTS
SGNLHPHHCSAQIPLPSLKGKTSLLRPMGRKNRNPAPNPTPPRAAAAGGIAAVRADCDKALAYLQRGNPSKALRLLRDAVARHGEGSPLLLRAQGTVHSRAAAPLNDPAARARHHRAALQAARRAVELAPDSLELAHFHALLLYEAASGNRDYEDVIAECERGLRIEVPSDPAPHCLRLPAPGPDQLRDDLRNLIQKANLASISTWVKALGGTDDKLGFFRLADEPLELQPLPAAHRPIGIKKATKTPEERRKEIEVQVAAMRLVEQHQLPHNPAVAASSPPLSEEDEAPCSS